MMKKDLGNTNGEKIENLNLVALRKYACNKINNQKDWYLRCLECQGLDSCSAGKRAVEIIEKETSPKEKKERPNPLGEKFKEALTHDDPAGWLYRNGYFDKRWRANDAIKKYCANHSIAKKTTSEVTATAVEKRMKAAKEHAFEIIDGSNSEEEILRKIIKNNPNTKSSGIYGKLYDWCRKYDLKNKDQAMSLARKLCNLAKRDDSGQRKGLSIQEAYEALFAENEESADEEDNVSIADFLKESSSGDNNEGNCSPSSEENEAAVNTDSTVIIKQKEDNAEIVKNLIMEENKKTAEAINTAENNQKILQTEFGKKKQELRRRFEFVGEQINKLQFLKDDLKKRIDILDQAAELFGMRSTT